MSSVSGARSVNSSAHGRERGLSGVNHGLEIYLTEVQRAPNKSPGLDGITLGYYKTYWDVNKDVMLIFYNQMFQETKITAA